MLDTIIYIPTILAYAFITLLVVILCFIVIYVSHKIYISVYDNLPVPSSHDSALFSNKSDENRLEKSSTAAKSLLITKHENSFRKPKTALRIIVTMEPCYLAYVVFEKGNPLPTTTTKTGATCSNLLYTSAASTTSLQHIKLIKYYDRLSSIPRGRVMQKCINSYHSHSHSNTYSHSNLHRHTITTHSMPTHFVQPETIATTANDQIPDLIMLASLYDTVVQNAAARRTLQR